MSFGDNLHTVSKSEVVEIKNSSAEGLLAYDLECGLAQ